MDSGRRRRQPTRSTPPVNGRERHAKASDNFASNKANSSTFAIANIATRLDVKNKKPASVAALTSGLATLTGTSNTIGALPSLFSNIESLTEALRLNQELQCHLAKDIHQIALQKAENRRVSHLLLHRLTYLGSHSCHNHHLHRPQSQSLPQQQGGDCTDQQVSTHDISVTIEKGNNNDAVTGNSCLTQPAEDHPRTTSYHDFTPGMAATADPIPNALFPKGKGNKRKRSDDTAETQSVGGKPSKHSQCTGSFLAKMTKRQRLQHLQLYQYNTQRRWNRAFFMDPSGSTPEPNAGAKLRRQVESQSDFFFFHLNPPWSNKQTKALQKIITESLKAPRIYINRVANSSSIVGHEEDAKDDEGGDGIQTVGTILPSGTSERATTNHNDGNSIDLQVAANFATETIEFWEKVAKQLQEKVPTNLSTTTASPRTAEECRSHFLEQLKTPSFNKPESLLILERVHLAIPDRPDWQAVASSLNDHSNNQAFLNDSPGNSESSDTVRPPDQDDQEKQQSTADILQSKNRTAWQCLVYYQTKLQPTTMSTWSPRQDSILFAYLAAMGPQFIWDMQSSAKLASHFFANQSTLYQLHAPKTNKQLLVRANQSLLNPNFQSDYWTADDERKLVLCMKVYSALDSDTCDCNNIEEEDASNYGASTTSGRKPPSAVNQIAKVHFPHRASTNVSSKWYKRMDPAYSWRAFTRKEDQAILQAVREYTHKKTTVMVAASPITEEDGRECSSASYQEPIIQFLQSKFPTWDAQRVFRRWKQRASSEDMMQTIGSRVLLEKAVKQNKWKIALRNQRDGRMRLRRVEPQEQIAAFDASDFVLQVAFK
jgi:hypothetical protein